MKSHLAQIREFSRRRIELQDADSTPEIEAQKQALQREVDLIAPPPTMVVLTPEERYQSLARRHNNLEPQETRGLKQALVCIPDEQGNPDGHLTLYVLQEASELSALWFDRANGLDPFAVFRVCRLDPDLVQLRLLEETMIVAEKYTEVPSSPTA